MENQEIVSYIQQQQASGMNDIQIKQSLLTAGWSEEDIDIAYRAVHLQNNHSQTSQTHRLLIIFGTITFFVVLIILTYIFLIQSKPEVLTVSTEPVVNTKTFDDSDLALNKVEVPDNENAYFELIKLENALSTPDDMRISSELISGLADGSNWATDLAGEVVSSNEEALAIFAKAATTPAYQDPAFADPTTISFNSILPNMKSWRDASRYSAIRAQLLAKQGDYPKAFEEAMNSLKVARLIKSSQLTTIEYILAEALHGIGLVAIQNIAKTTTDLSLLKKYANDLNEYLNGGEGLANVYKAEYLTISKAIDLIATGDASEYKSSYRFDNGFEDYMILFSDSRYFDPEKTKSYHAALWRKMIHNAEESCWAREYEDIYPLTASGTISKTESDYTYDKDFIYSTENSLGIILFDVYTSSINDLNETKCDTAAQNILTQTVLGIKAYTLDNNTYPQALAKLVPNYLSTILIDPYDGKPIKYSLEKKTVYSVGENLVDDGGENSGETSWRNMPDITVSVDF